MDIALHVSFRVIDDVVNIIAIQAVIACPRMAVNVGTALYVLANHALQRLALCVWDVP